MIGPASDLVEVEDAEGLKLTAIVFHAQWRQHPAITDALGVIEGFLESPMVTGLVELSDRDAKEGSFLYPTGAVWSVAELIRMLSDRGERGGIRAGLELMYTAGQILVEGAEAGEPQGVYSHGGLTPRRIMVKADGQVMVIGYGLPQVEILQFHATPNQLPREDSFRYCPPERIEARPEDLSSDLFGLCLIAFELMTGKPVYDGLVKDIRQQAARGEGSRRLFRFREVLPEAVRDVLTKVLRPDQDARYIGGDSFLEDIHTLLSDRNVSGPSLLNLMSELQSEHRRVGESVQAGSTQMVDAGQLREQLAPGAPATGRASETPWRREGPRRPVSSRGEEDLGEATPIDAADLGQGVEPKAAAAEPVVESAFDAPAAEADGADARWSKVRRQARQVRRGPEPSAEVDAADLARPSEDSVFELGGEVPVADPGAPAPPTVPPPSRRPVTRLGQTVRRATPKPSAPPVVPQTSSTPQTADDLLLAIRGRGSTEASGYPSEQHTAVLPKVEMVEVMLDPSVDDDSATVMMTPAQLRAKVAQADAEQVLAKPAPRSRPNPTPAPNLASPSSKAQVRVDLIDLSGQRHMVWVAADAGVGAIISAAVGDALIMPTDQAGTLEGWYRLELDGTRLPLTRTAVTLKNTAATVVWIEAGTRLVEVAISAQGKDVRFSNPMNTAVVVSSLVRHLQRWLALPEGDWCLMVDDKPLDPHMILDDLAGPGVLAVSLCQRAS